MLCEGRPQLDEVARTERDRSPACDAVGRVREANELLAPREAAVAAALELYAGGSGARGSDRNALSSGDLVRDGDIVVWTLALCLN